MFLIRVQLSNTRITQKQLYKWKYSICANSFDHFKPINILFETILWLLFPTRINYIFANLINKNGRVKRIFPLRIFVVIYSFPNIIFFFSLEWFEEFNSVLPLWGKKIQEKIGYVQKIEPPFRGAIKLEFLAEYSVIR